MLYCASLNLTWGVLPLWKTLIHSKQTSKEITGQHLARCLTLNCSKTFWEQKIFFFFFEDCKQKRGQIFCWIFDLISQPLAQALFLVDRKKNEAGGNEPLEFYWQFCCIIRPASHCTDRVYHLTPPWHLIINPVKMCCRSALHTGIIHQ